MTRKSITRTRSTLVLSAALIFGPLIVWAVYAAAHGQRPFQLQPPPGANQPAR